MQSKQYIFTKRNLKLKINETIVRNYLELSSSILISMANIFVSWEILAYE